MKIIWLALAFLLVFKVMAIAECRTIAFEGKWITCCTSGNFTNCW